MSPEIEALRKESQQKSEYITAHKKLIQAMLYEAIGMDETEAETEEEVIIAIRRLRQRAETAEKRLADLEPVFQVCSREEFERRQQCQSLKAQLEATKGEAKSFKDTIIGIHRHVFADLPEGDSPLGNRLQNVAARCSLAVPEIGDKR